ncbi:MAG: SH3 domain-containing protein [Coleofasciculaceae cyanobacterium]
MNSQKEILQTLGFTALYSLALTLIPKAVGAAEPPVPQTSVRYQVAQVSNCREVDVNTALNIRQQPGGRVIGTLSDAQNVNISGEPNNGWVEVTTPMEGYVFAGYLNYCAGETPSSQTTSQTTSNTTEGEEVSTVPDGNCRKTISPNVSVRKEPNGEEVGSLEENQEVYIANEGYDGWVPIERPVDGYVSSANLGLCSE